MKKFKIIHEGRKATYIYFLEQDENTGKFVLSLIYYDEIGSLSKEEDVITNFKHKNFFGDTEEEAVLKANNWVKENLGENFIVEEEI